MCLSIPAKVISIDGDKAEVSIGGTISTAALQLIDDVKVGDYVLLHTGFAIQKISEKEADETMSLFKELAKIHDKIEEDESEK